MNEKKLWFAGIMSLVVLTVTACGSNAPKNKNLDEELKCVETKEINSKETDNKKVADQKEIVKELEEEQKQDNTKQGLLELKNTMTAEGKLMAVAFLGYDMDFRESEDWTKYIKDYPFLESTLKDHYIVGEGNEIYAIVPPSKDYKLSVHTFQYNEDRVTGQEGECLYESEDGSPIILRCNISDIISNVQVTLCGGDEVMAWAPELSLRDNTLVVEPWIYDFSLNKIAEEEYYLFGKIGEWRCENLEGNKPYGYTVQFCAEPGEGQGDLFYAYQDRKQEMMKYVDGYYFSMGPDEEDENAWLYQFVLLMPDGGEKRGIIKTLQKEDQLIVTNVSGDSFFLLGDISSETFKFIAFDNKEMLDMGIEQACFETLNEIVEVQDYIAQGMTVLMENSTEMINGEECYVFAIGTDHEEQFVREFYYAVSAGRSVYKMDPITGEWQTVAFG